jgi:branched-chain amino acid transport system substrate-binding protein
MGTESRRGISQIIILMCVIFCLLPLICTAAQEGSEAKDEVVLYAVFPTQGEVSATGIASKVALEQAAEDMNTFYQEIGSNRVVKLNITEIPSDPQSALDAVKMLHESGVHMILGLFSSVQLEVIKPYSDENGILILAAGSTATSLSIPDDSIFRFHADDASQNVALNTLLQIENITAIVPLINEDQWINFKNFTILGKSMNTTGPEDVVRFDPQTRGYEEVVTRLDNLAGTILAHEDSGSVGVLAFTFDEIIPIMEEASNEKYQNLSKIRWIGASANMLNPELLKSPKAAKFGVERGYSGLVITHRPVGMESVIENINHNLGYEPNGFVYAVYDMGKIGSEIAFLHGSDTIEALKKAVIGFTENDAGVLGQGTLNAAGDRIVTIYDFWTLESNATSGVVWKKLGTALKYGSQDKVDVSLGNNSTTWKPAN